MKNILKGVVATIILALLLVVTFYFWGSSGWVDADDYDQIITYSEEAPTKDTLSVMTYNLGYLSGMTNNLPLDRPHELFNSNLDRAKSLFEEYSPDIIGFQEIDFDSDRSKNQNQLDSFGIAHSYHQGFASVNWDKRYVPFPYWPFDLHYGKMKSGQAILSHFPITNQESVVLERPSEAPFYYKAFYLDRMVQIVDVQIGTIIMKVMNIHLEAFYPKTRKRQAHVIRQLFEKFSNDMPVLLIGDFNSEAPWTETSGMVETMKTILSSNNVVSAIDENQYLADRDKSQTFSSDNPFKMIDFVLYNDNFIEKISAKVATEAEDISDHLPLIMRFTFKSENRPEITE